MNKSFGLLLVFALSFALFPSLPFGKATAAPEDTPDELFNRGASAYQAGNFEEAISQWNAGLSMAEAHGAKRLIRIFTANIGMAYAGLHDYANAVALYEKALRLNREAGDSPNTAITLNNLGVACMQRGHYDTALRYYNDALALRREAGDRRGEANVHNNMGMVFFASGRYKEAFRHIREAMEIYEAVKDHRGRIDALINLGVLYSGAGQQNEALDAYQQAEKLNQLVGNLRKQADILDNIGTVYLLRRNYSTATEYYEKALALHREHQYPDGLAGAMNNMGLAHRYAGRTDAALKAYHEALEIKGSQGDKLGEAAILGNIGLLYDASGKLDEALDYLTRSHFITAAAGLPEYHWRSCRGLGKTYAGLGNDADAVRYYLEAVDTIERLREGLARKEMKTAFMESRIHVYDELIALYMNMHQSAPDKGFDRRSFDIFERKQGRVFLEEMGKTGVRHFTGIPADLVETEARLGAELEKVRETITAASATTQGGQPTNKIEYLRGQAADIENQRKTLIETIKTDYPDYYALKYPRPVDLAQLQQQVLGPTEMLLIYNVMEDGSSLWVVGKNHFSLHRLHPGQHRMMEMVTAFRDNDINIFKGQALRGAADATTAGDGVSPGPALYNLLFPEPVPDIIKTADTIYIVPTGPLYLLPFEALKDAENRYLIESHGFAYLSSASLLNVLRAADRRRAAKPAYPFLAFANPVYDMPETISDAVDEFQVRSFYSLMRGAIDPLPETEDEVTLIKNILKAPENSKPLQVRENASRSMVFRLNEGGTLHNYRYLSFACHGLIPDEINGMVQPALLLSTPDPVTGEVGLLTMSDVFGLKLNADLVALSACNTARGEIVNGEGVMGLTRSFMYAGAPAICVNLWAVETVSAQKLNVAFFQTLQQGSHRADALRQGKLKLLRGEGGRQFKAPFFWAPMVLFGDGS